MNAVQERVMAIVAEVLGVKHEELSGDYSFTDDLGADSLDTVELIMALEEEFGCEISDQDVELLNTVEQVTDYLNERVE